MCIWIGMWGTYVKLVMDEVFGKGQSVERKHLDEDKRQREH